MSRSDQPDAPDHAPDHVPVVTHVLLVGGPTDLPPDLRRYFLRSGETTVKIPHRGGYEHFECVASTRGTDRPPLYQWTERTTAAE
ncbi:DUF5988 family protein [Nocardiopsis sp. NRRL B-16309]|uniref:DUF5988 family protein n=1 Tax=Nocardiopsis sp. NRRL B-16309 TaxID=1519494 RepID=UPI0006AF8443|nr:DUF5988 family protein [Nocardiopsis sp. NRRL B-16309]KOX12428.1 hypothetical protein ADL05_21275 [Nocardiopsis sp. NRRL B-16309]